MQCCQWPWWQWHSEEGPSEHKASLGGGRESPEPRGCSHTNFKGQGCLLLQPGNNQNYFSASNTSRWDRRIFAEDLPSADTQLWFWWLSGCAVIPGLHSMVDKFIFKTAPRVNPSPSPRQSPSLSALIWVLLGSLGEQWFPYDMKAFWAWLLLNHGAAIPLQGACYPAHSGHCGEHLVHLHITPVSLSSALQRMACFGVCL